MPRVVKMSQQRSNSPSQSSSPEKVIHLHEVTIPAINTPQSQRLFQFLIIHLHYSFTYSMCLQKIMGHNSQTFKK